MHFTTKPSRENLPVNQNRLTVKLWRRIACAVLCFVLLGSNLTVAFATEGSTATAAVEQSEASYTLVLTHHFQDGSESGLKVEETVTLAGADFPEGVCDLSRYARTYEQAAAEQPGSVSLNSFVEGKAAAEIVYTVQEGLTAGLDDNGAVVFQAAAQEPEPDPEPVNPQPEPEPEPDPEPVNPQPEPEPEQPEVITYTLTLTCRFTDAAGKVVDMPQTVTLTGADFTDNGYSVTAPQYDHAAANSPSVTVSLDSFDAHHKAAVTIAYTVQEGWTVSAGEDGGVTFAEVTQPQEEDSLMLALTHEFYQNGECVATTYSLHELTAGDFNGEGVLSTTSFAEKSDKITLTSAPSLSMEEAEDGYLVGTLCYEVKAGWKMVLKENAVSGRDDGISLFSEFQGGGKFDDYEFVAADVVTLRLQFKYSNTGGLAGVDASAPQTVEAVPEKQSDGTYKVTLVLPTDVPGGFRIVLNPSKLNKYVVSPPTGNETPEELKEKLENGDFNVDIDKYTIYYYQQKSLSDHNAQNPTYLNRYSDEYNQAWNAARLLSNNNYSAKAVCGNTGAHPNGIEDHGANALVDAKLEVTLKEDRLTNAMTQGLDITVYYRRNATWYTVNHWVPEPLADGAPADAEKKDVDGVTYVRLEQETIQGRVGATTAAKAKVGDAFALVSPKPFNQVLIEDKDTVVDIYYAAASSYRIIFDTDYTYIPRQQVEKGHDVDFDNVPQPTRTGYTFGGWRYLTKDATPDPVTGEYKDTDYKMAGTKDQSELTVDEALIASAKLVASGDATAIHLYPKWEKATTTVRVILWTENLTGTDDVQATASGGNPDYYHGKYTSYRNEPVTHAPKLGTSDSNYSNVGSFTVEVDTDSSLLNPDDKKELLTSIQSDPTGGNGVTEKFKEFMGQANGIDVAEFYTQAAFEIVHEEEDEVNYNATTASADGKTTIYVYFTRNIYTLQFHYYGEANNFKCAVATHTNGYSNSSKNGDSLVPDGNFNYDYLGKGGDWEKNMWAEVIEPDKMPVPQTITIRAKYGANLREVWPAARVEETIATRNGYSSGSDTKMISWATTLGKYCEDGRSDAANSTHKGESTIMGIYSAMSSEIIANPEEPNTTHHLVAYWNGNTPSYYRYNHCYEVPELNVNGAGIQKVSIYNNDTSNEKNFLYLVPTNNEDIAKYEFNDLMLVSYDGKQITYNDPVGGYYAVRQNTQNGAAKYYAVARQVVAMSTNAINMQNPSALSRANTLADHTTQYQDTDGAANDNANPNKHVGSENNPYDLYFYYNRDRYIITYMAPSNNSSTATEVTLGTVTLPYGAKVTREKYGFKLNYQDTNDKYGWTPVGTTPVCPDRAENGKAAWKFKGWGLGPAGVNMQWTMGENAQAGDAFAIESNMRLYAIWDAPTYTVTFHLNNNAKDIVEKVPANRRYSSTENAIPRPLRSGYTLVGWYASDKKGNITEPEKAFDFDQAITDNMHVAAKWQAVSAETFAYTVYYVTDKPLEADRNKKTVQIVSGEIVPDGGTTYYVLDQEERKDQEFIANSSLNFSAKVQDGYVPQQTNRILTMGKADDTYNVIFFYDPITPGQYVVNFVEAGTETSAKPTLVKTLTVQADQTVVTPQSAVAAELVNKGYALVNKNGNRYTAVNQAKDLQWLDKEGKSHSIDILQGDAIPETVTYLVQAIPYTISYQIAAGSPAGAQKALDAVTAAANTPVASAGDKNPTQYTAKDSFTVKNPANVLSNGTRYRFKNWTRGTDTTDTTQNQPVGYNPLKIDQGSTGNLTFVANWEAIPASELGSLTVSKTVTGNGGEQQKDFHFTVTLNDKSIDGSYGDMTFEDGKAEFTLKHGQSKSASDLPVGTGYTVVEAEANRNGYVTVATGDGKGTIQENGSVVDFTNTRDIKPGKLTVTKTVTGLKGDKTKAFTFVVKLSDESVNGVYGEMTFVNGRAEFTLKHGERKTAEGLPAGVAYTVKEGDNEGYTVRKIGDTGEIQEGRTAYARFTNRKTNLDYQPRTGDDTKLELWAGLTVLCFLGAVVSLVVSKKRKNKYNR